MTNIYDFSAAALDGRTVPLADFRGRVLLIVNTASQCGFTPQYAGLEALYSEFKSYGFSVLGFPCNQFGGQEPGADVDIAQFCSTTYGVSFPMFAKVGVNGSGAHPLFKYLTSEKKGVFGTSAIKWNFTKFLIDQTGEPIARFPPTRTPESLSGELRGLLKIV